MRFSCKMSMAMVGILAPQAAPGCSRRVRSWHLNLRLRLRLGLRFRVAFQANKSAARMPPLTRHCLKPTRMTHAARNGRVATRGAARHGRCFGRRPNGAVGRRSTRKGTKDTMIRSLYVLALGAVCIASIAGCSHEQSGGGANEPTNASPADGGDDAGYGTTAPLADASSSVSLDSGVSPGSGLGVATGPGTGGGASARATAIGAEDAGMPPRGGSLGMDSGAQRSQR